MKKVYLFFMITIFYGDMVVGKTNEKWVKTKVEQVHEGNFALSTSQQPGPLVGFGQNIVDKHDMQAFLFPDQLKGKGKNFVEVVPSMLYGINDKISLFIELPIAVKFKNAPCTSHDFEDLIVQFEGVVYAQETTSTINEITLLGNIAFPTGTVFKQPPTGFGALSFFLGFTASHTATDWYYFMAGGVILPLSHNHTKFGNQILYQFGVSKNIGYKADTWIFNWMVELDGLYRQRNKLLGVVDPNSGGNMLTLGPSLWFSTQQLILQFGISAVISEHLFGVQSKDSYFMAANLGWKF